MPEGKRLIWNIWGSTENNFYMSEEPENIGKQFSAHIGKIVLLSDKVRRQRILPMLNPKLVGLWFLQVKYFLLFYFIIENP